MNNMEIIDGLIIYNLYTFILNFFKFKKIKIFIQINDNSITNI